MINKLIYLLFCMILAVNIRACSSSQKNDESPTQTATEAIILEETIEPMPMSTPTPTPEYAYNKVVNQFIIDYNNVSQSDFTDIKKGNSFVKNFAYSYGYYCELQCNTSTNKIVVIINETADTASLGMNGMRDIFHDVAITINPELTDDEIYAYFDELVQNEHITESEFGTMSIKFKPGIDLSTGRSRGFIKIEAQ